MKIFNIVVGPFEVNSYILVDETSGQCLLVDPGDEPKKIIEVVEKNQLFPQAIVNTHCHIDHTRYLSEIKDYFKIPFYIHEEELPLLEALKEQALFFGLDTASIPEVDDFLIDGQNFKVNELEFKILHTPGHSPGSICLYQDGHVFVGDVLFKGAIGRTDLYGGNYHTLMRSITEKLLALPDATQVHCGHGESTTIGAEKQTNPFLKEFLNGADDLV